MPGDTNAVTDVFVRQLNLHATERASVSSTGVQGNKPSFDADMGDGTGGGGILAFSSSATNLVPGDTNSIDDVFRRDTSAGGLTDRWSVSTSGAQATTGTVTGQAAMVHNGQAVAFVSNANNLVAGDTLLTQDVFFRFP